MPTGPVAVIDGHVFRPFFLRSRDSMRQAMLVFALLAAGCGGDDSGGISDGGGVDDSGFCSGPSCPTVVGTPECTAFCTNITNACGPGAHCDDQFFCRIQPGECAASTRARLACSAMNTPTCLDAGWALGGCGADNSVCSSDAGG